MNLRVFFSLFAFSLPVLADTAEVEQCVRKGEYVRALEAVTADDVSPEAMFWKGRAFVGLRRMLEAAHAFSKVPSGHPLYPYAAKGIVFCAWESEFINFVEAVAPLTISPDPEISALATAALAEYQLRYTNGGDTASLDELRRLSRKHPEWQPALRLLEVENLRRTGKFDEAVSLCRAIEADTTLDLATRHRARLALAEVYYNKEAANSGTPVDVTNGEVDEDGMGEETLLQFISANPESPLLYEAFRRLASHRAFTTSKYASRCLGEWVEDISKPKRAALALLMQQRAAFAAGDYSSGATLANAASAFSGEKAARMVILEQVRVLLSQGKRGQAELFLNLVPADDDPYWNFYHASLLPPGSKEAKDAYELSARTAPGKLLPAAVSNALFCACKGGDEAAIRELLRGEYPRHARRELLLTYASLLQKDEPETALQALSDLEQLDPLPAQRAEILLMRAGINLDRDPSGTLASLLDVPENELEAWTDTQILRCYRLQLEAMDKLTGNAGTLGIERVRRILETCKRPAVTVEMLFNLAGRLSACGAYSEALQHLERLVSLADTTETKAHALLLAAEAAAKIGSLDAYAKSIGFFEQCSRLASPYAHRADIHRARVLVWINRTDEALQLLFSLLRREESMNINDRALLYTALAEAYSIAGSEEGNRAALEYSAKVLQLPDLPEAWHIRGKMLHADLCARYGFNDKALSDYLGLLSANPDTGKDSAGVSWFVLAYAGSGAVDCYLRLGQQEEAAALAEQISAKFSHHPSPETAAEQSRLFSNWATDIRRNFY